MTRSFFRIATLLLATVAVVVSCEGYDDSGLRSEINSIKDRLKTLEDKIEAVNGNISSLQTIVTNVQGRVFISGLRHLDDGYIITFSDGNEAVIRNGVSGVAPVIGVRKDSDGVYYWTLDGEWLTGDDGGKLPVTGNTPQMKIEDGYWWVSADTGQSWDKLAAAPGQYDADGDPVFEAITYDDSSVIFTMADGSVFMVGRGASTVQDIVVIPDYNDFFVDVWDGVVKARFIVVPSTAAESLGALSVEYFRLRGLFTKTPQAGDMEDLPILSKSVSGDILTIEADCSCFSPIIEDNVELAASAALFIDDGENAVSSGFFRLLLYHQGSGPGDQPGDNPGDQPGDNPGSGDGYSCPPGADGPDLGLSVIWADYNLGASSPWEPGDFFAWGETAPKTCYSLETYKWGDPEVFAKNNEYTLTPEHDAASVNWGKGWRIPTIAEVQEFIGNTTSQWTEENGVYGRRFYSKVPGYEEKSVFLPAPGHYDDAVLSDVGTNGWYWTSSLKEDSLAMFFYFHFGTVEPTLSSVWYGKSVRPVRNR